IVGLAVGVRIAHAMEDCFVAAQHGRIALGQTQIDRLLGSTDLLMRIANTPETDIDRWAGAEKPEVDACLSTLVRIVDADRGLERLEQQPSETLHSLRDELAAQGLTEQARTALAGARRISLECQQVLAERLHEPEMFDRRALYLSNRLYDEALTCRMRPFADGI